MGKADYRAYEPVSLCPAAPGWRAVFLIDDPAGLGGEAGGCVGDFPREGASRRARNATAG
jgi:hypothetical protein